ncbi:MAG: hypothetical protein ACE5OS_11120 [Anaerolineae bacterium]
MTEQPQRYRICSHLTRSRFLHVEDALGIGKVRLFARPTTHTPWER